jgi:hypothetical protein
MIFIGAVLLLGCFQPLDNFHTAFWWGALFVTALSVWSGCHYFIDNTRLFKAG